MSGCSLLQFRGCLNEEVLNLPYSKAYLEFNFFISSEILNALRST